MNDFLTGSNANLSTVIDSALDKLRGIPRQGNDVVTSLDVDTQRAAVEGLAGKCGAAVAIEPSTGRVLALASAPTFDPNLVESDFDSIEAITAPCKPAAPLLDRATAGRFVPGSTFKIVTASAALDTGKFTPESVVRRPRLLHRVRPAGVQLLRPGAAQRLRHGDADPGRAELHQLGVLQHRQGPRRAEPCSSTRSGSASTSVPPIDLPSEEVLISGLYRNGRLYDPEDPSQVDPGRLAFGQERLVVTPLQMALVAAGVANDGVVMEPNLVDEIVAPDGDVIQRFEPEEWKTAIKPSTAADLTAMMVLAVQSGTGVAAQIPGISVAGKTGTAETGVPGHNNTWFIAFAPAERPEVAVAVALSGSGRHRRRDRRADREGHH